SGLNSRNLLFLISQLEFALAVGILPSGRAIRCAVLLAWTEFITAAVLDVARDCGPTRSTQSSKPPTSRVGCRPSFSGLYTLNSYTVSYSALKCGMLLPAGDPTREEVSRVLRS